ncbi:LysR family transcriptional regulator [Ramlibacter sp. MAHUQ-53]|uniref:LysR family transcriptional regulator n=1 Tax=unclassified Ramlibacter TaxID=2617605 RepID=UPI003637941E
MQNHLELLRIFQAAAEGGSFREAAARLGTSPQSVTRSIQELEAHFGELLFHRSTRQVRITAFGEQLAVRARSLLSEAEALFHPAAQDAATAFTGRVRITAPRVLGRVCVVPALGGLSATQPGLALDVLLSDAFADVVDEQIDVGVRIGFLRDNRFVARKAGEVAFCLVATPGLLARIRAPRRLEDLADLPVTALLDPNTGRTWPWHFEGGRQFTPGARTFLTDDPDAELGAILAGAAIGQVPDYLCAPLLRAGRLVSLLPQLAPPPWGVYVYRPQRGPVPARVRLVFDHIVEAVRRHGEGLRG